MMFFTSRSERRRLEGELVAARQRAAEALQRADRAEEILAQRKLHCSFCGAREDRVKDLIWEPTRGMCICDVCTEDAWAIVQEKRQKGVA